MSLPKEILDALNSQRILPSRAELKRMIDANKWDEIGRIFNFTPQFFSSTSVSEPAINWKCLPKSLTAILWSTDIRAGVGWPESMLKQKSPRGRQRGIVQKKYREHLYAVQNGICHYCQQHIPYEQWSVDHKLPLSRGGTNAKINRVGSCKACNNDKGSQTEIEYLSRKMKPYLDSERLN